MPALHTHYKFGHDVLEKLNNKQKKEIKSNISYYDMYNQGFDNLYYHFKWNYYKNFGIKAHKNNIELFFKNAFDYIKTNNLENTLEVTTLIYGFINHYTLDTLLHPYINYQVKNLNISHTKIEFILDNILNSNINGKNYKIIIPKLKFNQNLIKYLDYIFDKTYNEKNIGKIFNRSHNNGYYLYRYFIHDKYGFKTFCYKIIDFLLPFKKFKLGENTFYVKKINKKILNKEKHIWNHPKSKKEIYNYSCKELYNIALKISIKLSNEAYNVIHNNKSLEKFLELIKLIDLKNISELLKK